MLPVSGLLAIRPVLLQLADRERERHVAAGDRRAAGAAVGLEHVAVDVDRALAERVEVRDAAQAAADQALDLDPAAVLLALGDVALLALAGRRGQHPVLGGQPAAAAAGHPARHGLLGAGGADHPRAAAGDQRRAGRRAHEPGLDRHRPQLVGRAAVAALARLGHLDELGLHRDVLDRADRQLQEARAGRAQRLGVAGGQEPVVALHGGGVAQPAAAEHVLDLPGDRVARADDLHTAAEHPLQHRPDQRVVRAAEDHRVHLRVAQRARVVAHRVDDLRVERRAALDQRHEPRAGDAGDGHERVRGRDRLLVGAAVGPSPASPCSRRGRCGSRPRPAPHRAARRRARRRRASSASSVRAAPAAPPRTRCCTRPRAA